MESQAVLGLSINTRVLGLAVISGPLLLDYHIQLRKGPWTPRKRELILTSLQPWCSSYSIKNIALSIPYEKQLSTQTKELLESLTRYFSQKKIIIYPYPSQTLHSLCEGADTKSKKEIMRKLAERYPELLYLYRKEMANKNKYYVKLFEAVGVATLHFRKLNRK